MKKGFTRAIAAALIPTLLLSPAPSSAVPSLNSVSACPAASFYRLTAEALSPVDTSFPHELHSSKAYPVSSGARRAWRTLGASFKSRSGWTEVIQNSLWAWSFGSLVWQIGHSLFPSAIPSPAFLEGSMNVAMMVPLTRFGKVGPRQHLLNVLSSIAPDLADPFQNGFDSYGAPSFKIPHYRQHLVNELQKQPEWAMPLNLVGQPGSVHAYLIHEKEYRVILGLDTAMDVLGRPGAIENRMQIHAILGTQPGDDLGEREFLVQDLASGTKYGQYKGWWLLRYGLPYSVSNPGIQALVIQEVPSAERRPWWKDPFRVLLSESLSIFSLRRRKSFSGFGKFTDLPGHYAENKKRGVDIELLLPHFAVISQSPYDVVSSFGVNERMVDLSVVQEVRDSADLSRWVPSPQKRHGKVNYSDVEKRETFIAEEAAALFFAHASGERKGEFDRFVQEQASWIGDYAEFMTLYSFIGTPWYTWTPAQLAKARANPLYARQHQMHLFMQWQGYGQIKRAIDDVHAQGGKVFADFPMFRSKNSVEVWKHPEFYREPENPDRYPGIRIGSDVNEHWRTLALWNWVTTAADQFEPQLAPYRHWLPFFDGGRVDAAHFAGKVNFAFNNLDQPADPYYKALADVFREHRRVPVAEAFDQFEDGRAAKKVAQGFGFLTVGEDRDDWKRMSDHDDNAYMHDHRGGRDTVLTRLIDRIQDARWPDIAQPVERQFMRVVNIALGHLWLDTERIKIEQRQGDQVTTTWDYQVPHPDDPDYFARTRADLGVELEALAAYRDGNIWRAPDAVAALLLNAADSFVKELGHTEIWAASDPYGVSFKKSWGDDKDPWFQQQWGRDAFISLHGTLLTTGRFEQAKRVIRHFSEKVQNGIIPNRIWSDDHIMYNNVDGSLWFMMAVQDYVAASGDTAFLDEMRPILRQIMHAYSRSRDQAIATYTEKGKTHWIYSDSSDGLPVNPEQATWMDAQPGDMAPITPRDGKSVEVIALYYAALRFMATFDNDSTVVPGGYTQLGNRVKASFQAKFWNAEAGALYDVIDGRDPHHGAIRPNMLIAVSRGLDLLTLDQQKKVVERATRDLLTPYGLRTLSPLDSNYKGHYDTRQDPVHKDPAYHQGTVWPWLIGPYVDALAKVRAADGVSPEAIREEVRELLTPLTEELVTTVYGTISEIYTGDWPHTRQGTPSQAWSVGEVLRVLVQYGVLDQARVREINKDLMKPHLITTDSLRPKDDGTFEITARAYGHSGFVPEKLHMHAWTHHDAIPNWGDEWKDPYPIPMHYDGRGEDGAFIYRGSWKPESGQHELIVRAAAPLRMDDWVYSQKQKLVGPLAMSTLSSRSTLSVRYIDKREEHKLVVLDAAANPKRSLTTRYIAGTVFSVLNDSHWILAMGSGVQYMMLERLTERGSLGLLVRGQTSEGYSWAASLLSYRSADLESLIRSLSGAIISMNGVITDVFVRYRNGKHGRVESMEEVLYHPGAVDVNGFMSELVDWVMPLTHSNPVFINNRPVRTRHQDPSRRFSWLHGRAA